MATMRNKCHTLGAAAPNLENLDTYAATATHMRKNRTTSQSSEHNKAQEGSVKLGIPGAFASSPVTVEGSQEPGPTTDELEEQYAEAHISITMGESINEEQSELCPPGESSND
ncbi:hypothetical protein FRC11_014039, partial [Ceratobasidium sp. 423]